MTTTEILLLIGLVAFVLLVGFLIALTLKLIYTLKNIDRVVNNTDTLTKDAALKMECIHPMFRIMSNLGEGLEYKSLAYKNEAIFKECVREYMGKKKEENLYVDLIDLAVLSAKLWKDLKKK